LQHHVVAEDGGDFQRGAAGLLGKYSIGKAGGDEKGEGFELKRFHDSRRA
jgi:hypothetical protein